MLPSFIFSNEHFRLTLCIQIRSGTVVIKTRDIFLKERLHCLLILFTQLLIVSIE